MASGGAPVKTLTFTDAELEAVRRAVAGLAKSNPHLTTALAKLDRGTDQRRVEIVLDIDSEAAKWSAPLFAGLLSRWSSRFAKLVEVASKRGKVTVYVDGAPVDLATLVENEVIP